MASNKNKPKAGKNARTTSRASFAIASLQHHLKSQSKIIYRPIHEHHSREGELHPSSYPFCGLEHAWNIVTNKQREPMDFFGQYYTGLGTFAHELMQRQFGRGKQILGDWHCLDCGKKKKLTYYSKCKKCGSEKVEYDELLIKFGRHTVGHVDGVVKLDGKLYVIDYKTSSVKNNNKHRETGNYYPYKHNVAQIKSYCFHPDTLVVTDKGKVPIKDIVSADYGTYKALSYNHATKYTEYKDITFKSLHVPDEAMIEIEYEGGSIQVTESHEIWSETRQTYIKAKDIQEGEDLLLFKD